MLGCDSLFLCHGIISTNVENHQHEQDRPQRKLNQSHLYKMNKFRQEKEQSLDSFSVSFWLFDYILFFIWEKILHKDVENNHIHYIFLPIKIIYRISQFETPKKAHQQFFFLFSLVEIQQNKSVNTAVFFCSSQEIVVVAWAIFGLECTCSGSTC